MHMVCWELWGWFAWELGLVCLGRPTIPPGLTRKGAIPYYARRRQEQSVHDWASDKPHAALACGMSHRRRNTQMHSTSTTAAGG